MKIPQTIIASRSKYKVQNIKIASCMLSVRVQSGIWKHIVMTNFNPLINFRSSNYNKLEPFYFVGSEAHPLTIFRKSVRNWINDKLSTANYSFYLENIYHIVVCTFHYSVLSLKKLQCCNKSFQNCLSLRSKMTNSYIEPNHYVHTSYRDEPWVQVHSTF